MRRQLIIFVLLALAISSILSLRAATREQDSTADVAAYQLGVIAEAVPGSNITYTLTLTNFGPAPVASFYLLDGWSVDAQGTSAFASPLTDPDFGKFEM